MEEELPQLESANIQRMLKGLSVLEQEPRKQKDDTYQEYQRAAIEALKPSFINVIKSLYAQSTNSKFLNNIVTNHAKYFSCLLAYGEQIVEAMNAEVWGERGEGKGALFTLSHRAFTSQSVLFAFLLAKRTHQKVTLIATEYSLLPAGHIVGGAAEEDKLSFVRSALLKEGVGLIELREWDRSTPLPADSFVVIDVFGLSPLQYAPLLLRGGWAHAAVYHSHLQDAEVAGVLSSVGKSALPLQLWPEHPTEAQAAKDETGLLGALLDFLAEDRAHPQKQDAVIFFPVETHPKRFAAKLGEALSKAGLRDCVNVVTRAHQSQPRTKNNIFVAEGTEQLLTWNYDYANVVYAVDYGTERHTTFNYELCAYQQVIAFISPLERARRQSLIGDSHFGIYSYFADQQLHRIDDLDRAKDISTYILRMIDYGIQAHLDLNHNRVKQALSLLERLHIIGRQGDSLCIIDEQVLSYAKKGISPIQSRFILNVLADNALEKYTNKYATLAIFMCVCLHSKQSIRKHKQDEGLHRSKPTEMWRKGGYLESCLAIIAECESHELYVARESESQSFRRASSKMEESESDPFGSFYQLIEGPNGMEGQKISIPNFLQENSIDEDVFFMVREEIDHYRDLFNVPKLSILTDHDYFRPVLKHYVQLFRDSLLYYSGFMRKGYRSENLGQYIQINPQSLKRQTVKPHFISVMRLQTHQGKKQITHWNTVQEIDYMQAAGGLPIAERLSKQEAEVQFHGISSLLFERLWRNNGLEVMRFQQEKECFVEANQEMALIIVHCSRQREKEVQERFQAILTKIRTGFQASNRLTNYFGSIKFYVGAGGAVKEMVIGQYVSKGLVENLSLDVTKEDLLELIEQFLVVRDINMRLPEPGQQTKSAVIFFNSQRDYYAFYDYFNGCEYLGNKLKVSPVRRSKLDSAWQRYSIQFQWSVWQSHCKAIIRFANKASAVKAYETFSVNPSLDGSKVVIRLEERTLFIDELNELTDEAFLEEVFKQFGAIEEVDILKTPLREATTDILELQNIAKSSTQHGKFTMEPVVRGKNGLRSCVFVFQNSQDVMKVVSEHNKSEGRVGVSRLYALPHFQRSMQVSQSLRSVSLAIIEQLLEEYQGMNLFNRKLISFDVIEEQIVFRSADKVFLDNFFNAISTKMRGENVKLKKGEKALLFNEIGLANLMDLEEKYNCKLIVNVALQTLAVIARKKSLQSINKEISSRIINSFFYKIHLNSKSYRHFRSHPEILTELKEKHKLKLVELESDQQSIILQGGIVAIQSANIYLMFLVQSINQPEETRVHSDVCGICCLQPKSSYRLQSCFHRFCTQCMQQYIRNVLGDASQFPIKCPHCCQLIIVQDLALILDKAQWQKSDTLGINRFMSDHSDTMSFCYTAGCKQINIYNGPVYNCDTCKFSYCNKCKEIVHPGFNCDQAIEIRQTDAYFLKYMVENGIRKCPNANCGMPVVKVDGCNKVLCTRCGKSMCFKCPPELMIAYNTPQEAYDHLNAKHGGYW